MAIRHRAFPRSAVPLPITIEAWLLVASIVLAIILLRTDFLPDLLASLRGHNIGISFASGLFFSSGIVTPLAIVAIIESSHYVPLFQLAVIGGIGAVAGDLLAFRFLRSQLMDYAVNAMLHPSIVRFGTALTKGPLWWLVPLVGMIVIASPLPDEFGLIMMGLSAMRLSRFIPLMLIANIVGIAAIALGGLSVPIGG